MNAGSTGELSPDIVTAVLRHFEWSPTSKVPGKYEVWKRTNRGNEEILVPLDPGRGDFRVLLNRAFDTVVYDNGAEAERLVTLLQVKTSASLDSTQWRKQTSVNAGLISWVEGEALYSSAQIALVASAKATKSRRMLHGNASGYIAKKFLESTLMGQTEIGSFVITAHVPANQDFYVSKADESQGQADFRKGERVTGRAILSTLERSLTAVRVGLDEYKKAPTIDTFIPLVEDGVSFELVRSLATLTDGGDAAVLVEFNGVSGASPLRRTEVAFDAVESRVLENVAKRFSESEPPQAVRVVGEVSMLDNSSSSPVRLVRLDVFDGADVRHAKLRLSQEQYDLAVEAHASHRLLSVSGQLEKEGRTYWLYNAEDAKLVARTDLPVLQQLSFFDDEL